MTPGARNLLNPREVLREVRFLMRRISIEVAPVTYKLLLRAAEARGVSPVTALNDAILAYAFGSRPPAPPPALPAAVPEAAPPPPAPKARPVRELGLTSEQWKALDAIGAGDPSGGRVPFGNRGATRPVAYLTLKSLHKRGLTTTGRGGYVLTAEGAARRAEWLEARATAAGDQPPAADAPPPQEPDSAPDAG